MNYLLITVYLGLSHHQVTTNVIPYLSRDECNKEARRLYNLPKTGQLRAFCFRETRPAEKR